MPDDNPVSVFVSYARADKRWLDRLKIHLTPLHKQYEIDIWEDTRVKSGSKWRKEIQDAVNRANIAVLIVSADFLASDFIRTNELPPLLKAAEEEGALILPIVASPSLFLWDTHLSQFQAVNDPSEPLISARDGEREAVFLKVAEAILERAGIARKRTPSVTAGNQVKNQENFLEHNVWNRLIKIGDWIFDEANSRIIGSGQQAYLISRDEYGDKPFEINAKLEFTNFDYPVKGESLGMNAGIIFGWKQDKEFPRYYNILISGSDILLERIGFQGGATHRDYEHITDAIELRIEKGTTFDFRVLVTKEKIEIFVNNRSILSIKRPTGVVGRVGIRPWRSKMDCTLFTVTE
ncbi:MAG: toll/interleukin-1 receptor domain-containing protein [Candidatus Omnitrophica bacterium]|nr:toll/interleukin-1 receptor domain-containing protein [Candidatus Omnitrophota bacterium]